jgi:MFS family permease
MTNKSIEKIWNPKFTQVAIITSVFNMGHFMMNTLVPKYADSLGATAALVGIVSSMFAVSSFGIRPFSGSAMDYYRKNRLLSFALAIVVLAFIGYAFSRSVAIVIISRLFHGVGIGIAAPLSMAMASSALPESRLASGLGVFSLNQAISTAIGPTVALALVDAVGYSATFLIVAAFVFVGFILTLRLKSNAPPKKSKFRIQLKRIVVTEVITPTVITMHITIAFSSINFFIVIYGGLRGIADIGLYFTAYAVALLASRPFSGKVADKYGADKAIIPGLVLFGVSFVLISSADTLFMFLIAGVVSAFGYGVCIPLLMTLSMQLVPHNKRGAASNTNYIGTDTGYIVGPTLAGFLVTKVKENTGNEIAGYEIMYLFMIIPVAAALIILLFKRKRFYGKSSGHLKPANDKDDEAVELKGKVHPITDARFFADD